MLKEDLEKGSEGVGDNFQNCPLKGPTLPAPSARLAPGIGAEGSLGVIFIPIPCHLQALYCPGDVPLELSNASGAFVYFAFPGCF